MKTEKKPKNKKKVWIIVAIVAIALLAALASPFIFYSGPSSMTPAKWTDSVYTQSTQVDFSKYTSVTISGNLEGKEVSAIYSVRVENDLPVVSRVEGSGDEAALAKLNDEIIGNVLLTFTKSTEIADGVSADSYGDDAICLLQKFTFEVWHGDEDNGDATATLLTWTENLALESYTVSTRPDGNTVSALTFSWN